MSAPTRHGPPPPDSGHPSVSPAQRLAAQAAAAAEARAYQSDPDVVALRVERLRTQVEHLMWTGIGLGLCFTMTTVQHFAATDTPTGSLVWWAAWLLDPMVSLVLLAVLRAEQATTRAQVHTGPWPRITKWVLLSATYVMNTWAYWAAGSASGVVLHSVPPLVVVIAAEALTELQYALTDCAQRAAHTPPATPSEQAQRAAVTTTIPEQPAPAGTTSHPEATSMTSPVGDREHHPAAATSNPVTGGGEQLRGPAGERSPAHPVNPPAPHAGRGANRGGAPHHPPPGSARAAQRVRRKLLADYLTEARTAYTPGTVITPAWVRQVTTCSRGSSTKIATTLAAELTTTHHPAEGGTTARTDRDRDERAA
ncbi:MAG: hypothetical protein JO115_03860 [Pseudonocardiales bacterium]|nr:hypothetical protein [Pseudonocardiales bacterium]